MTRHAAVATLFLLIANAAPGANPTVRLPLSTIEDKIRGGMLGQVLGNLNGLPHEFKYVAEPGDVTDYTPSLPEGARTDDDTDLEWVYVTEIELSGRPMTPPERLTELWRSHINRGIWCANRYSRDLMDLGFLPPDTGSPLLSPWATFNIAGQFGCESFGLMAPAMPQTAARLGLHYVHVTVDGEPTQATQLFAAMIAMAFIADDLETVLEAGAASVDPASEVAAIVAETRRLCADNPDDWRATRAAIKEHWQTHGGSFRDQNGYELNTASTVAAIVYGEGDLVETLRLAFNFGWDCDNNAATAATIVGVMRGRRWIDAQGWPIKDTYRNTSRDGMPTDETLTRYEDRLIACAMAVLREAGGEVADGVCVITVEAPACVETLADSAIRQARDGARFLGEIERNLTGDPASRARAAYLAICLGEADRIAAQRPDEWRAAVAELASRKGVVGNLFGALPGTADDLKEAAKSAGLTPPATP